MSKLLNLKGVKLFAVIVLAVAILATFGMVALTAEAQTAAEVQAAATVRSGSSGGSVVVWQNFLTNYTGASLVADGKFGPLTNGAARAWQASRGLVADGILGPLSRASAMAQINAAVGATFPAGCTSASGFSTVTGQPCTAMPPSGLPAGCSSTAGFSPTTGVRCDSGSTLPAGCTSTAGYSPTTGAKCDGATPAPISASGEGSATLSYAPVPANSTSMNRGESKNMMALEVKATGSDMKVTRVWLDINTRIWLSASQVDILDGGTVVATLPLSASTVEEITAGTAYRLQFNGLNITVPVNTTKTLTFRVTRPDLTNADADVSVFATSTIRATDMAGFSETYAFTGMGTRTWVFNAAAAATGTLTNTLNASSPKSQSNSGLSTTAGQLTAVKLLDFNLKAEDGAVNVTSIAGTLAKTGGGTLGNMVASVELRDGSSVLSSKAGATPFVFNELNIDIAEGTTKTLSVWVQMNPIGADAAGFTLKGTGFTAAITPIVAGYATSGPTFAEVTTSNTVTGEVQYMFEYAPTIAFVSASATNTGVDNRDGSYSLSFSVTAPSGTDIYISDDVAITSVEGDLRAEQTTATSIGGTLAVAASVTNAVATGSGDYSFRISAGTTATFTVTGLIPGNTGTAGFTGMKLTEVDWNTVNDFTGDVDQTWGFTDFKTPSVFVTGAPA